MEDRSIMGRPPQSPSLKFFFLGVISASICFIFYWTQTKGHESSEFSTLDHMKRCVFKSEGETKPLLLSSPETPVPPLTEEESLGVYSKHTLFFVNQIHLAKNHYLRAQIQRQSKSKSDFLLPFQQLVPELNVPQEEVEQSVKQIHSKLPPEELSKAFPAIRKHLEDQKKRAYEKTQNISWKEILASSAISFPCYSNQIKNTLALEKIYPHQGSSEAKSKLNMFVDYKSAPSRVFAARLGRLDPNSKSQYQIRFIPVLTEESKTILEILTCSLQIGTDEYWKTHQTLLENGDGIQSTLSPQMKTCLESQKTQDASLRSLDWDPVTGLEANVGWNGVVSLNGKWIADHFDFPIETLLEAIATSPSP